MTSENIDTSGAVALSSTDITQKGFWESLADSLGTTLGTAGGNILNNAVNNATGVINNAVPSTKTPAQLQAEASAAKTKQYLIYGGIALGAFLLWKYSRK